MEKWQISFVEKNLPDLLGNIFPNKTFLAFLQQKKLLSVEECENATGLLSRTDQVYYIIRILKTRLHGFYGLLHALKETNQTKAVEILKSSDLNAILFSNLTVNGVERKLKDVFPAVAHLDIKTLLRDPKINEDFLSIFEEGTRKLQILEHGIPEKYKSKIYVTRHISNRVMVKQELFEEKCQDIFVFNGISRHQLTSLVREDCGTSTSSDQLLKIAQVCKISAQYILLEDESEWEELLKIADKKIPVHLIHVETSSSCWEYVLVRSTGISNVVQQYMINKRHSTEASILEDEFVRNLGKTPKTIGICICDEPGMGKSWLLANIAQNLLRTSEILCVSCFVCISDCVKSLKRKVLNKMEAIRAILSFCGASALSIEIICFLMQETNLRMECFFDGYDEISPCHQYTADHLLKTLNQEEHIRVFATARPHMRKNLEELLAVTAYDIIPFTLEQQKQYLIHHWQEKRSQAGFEYTSTHVSRLKDFATEIIQHFPRHNSTSEDGTLGVPLKCFLLAEVYEELARRYAEMQTGQLEFITNTNPCLVATSLFSKYLDMGLKKLTRDRRFKGDIVALHMRKAMQLIFPNYADNVRMTQEEISESDLLAPGFLQKAASGYEFFHRLFAEFLVAKRFAEDIVRNNVEESLVITFFTDFLRYQNEEPSDRILPSEYSSILAYHKFKEHKESGAVTKKYYKSYVFKHVPLLEFLNGVLEKDRVFETLTGNFSQDVFKDIDDTVVFRILLSSTRGNLYHVLRLLLRLIEMNSSLLTKAANIFQYGTLQDEAFLRSWQLLFSASKYGGREISKIVTNFLLTTMKTGNIFAMMPEWMETPLHAAVQKGDYSCTEYFQKHITIHDRCLLYYVLDDTYHDTPREIRNKEDIIRMLVSKDNTLLHETSVHIHHGTWNKYSAPICVRFIHFELIKVMIDLKANVLAKDNKSRNVLEIAAVSGCYSRPEEFAELLRFFHERFSSSTMNELLNSDHFTKPTSINLNDYWCKLPRYLIERILQMPGFDVNQKDKDGIPLIHLCYYPDITQLLISYGADINEISQEFKINDMLTNPESDLYRTWLSQKVRIHGTSYVEEVETMRTHGWPIEDETFGFRRNVAHSVSYCCDPEAYYKWTTYMINAGYSRLWKSEDIWGLTPLEWAVTQRNVKKECIELIVFHTGIGINEKRNGEQSLVQLAAKWGFVYTLKALAALGADWKQLDNEGRSTLHLSIIGGDVQCIKFIMDQGVSISAEDHLGRKPIHEVASSREPRKVTSFLLNNGADLFSKDAKGNTVAHSLKWFDFSYRRWKEYVLSIGKGELFKVRNNDNLLPDDIQKP